MQVASSAAFSISHQHHHQYHLWQHPSHLHIFIVQSTARKNELPLDKMCLVCDVTKKMTRWDSFSCLDHFSFQNLGKSSLLLREKEPTSMDSSWRYSAHCTHVTYHPPCLKEKMVPRWYDDKRLSPGCTMGSEWRNYCWIQAERTPSHDAGHVCQGI